MSDEDLFGQAKAMSSVLPDECLEVNKDICTHCGEHRGYGEVYCTNCGKLMATLRNSKNEFNCIFCNEDTGECFFNVNWTCSKNCNRKIRFNPRTELESKRYFDTTAYYMMMIMNKVK